MSPGRPRCAWRPHGPEAHPSSSAIEWHARRWCSLRFSRRSLRTCFLNSVEIAFAQQSAVRPYLSSGNTKALHFWEAGRERSMLTPAEIPAMRRSAFSRSRRRRATRLASIWNSLTPRLDFGTRLADHANGLVMLTAKPLRDDLRLACAVCRIAGSHAR